MPGPVPKHPSQRTRAGSGGQNLAFRTVDVPKLDRLPERPSQDLLKEGEDWHPAVLRWWSCWRESPLVQDMPETDVFQLEIIAVLRQEFMMGRKFNVAAELRQREAAFGATPADRMKLRILTLDADVKEAKKPTPKNAPSGRFEGIRLVENKSA